MAQHSPVLSTGRRLVAWGVAFAWWASPAAAQDSPRFSTTVELLPIDVTVVDDRGVPVTDLTASEFAVEVDGESRRVVSAEWVPLVVEPKPAAEPIPAGYSSNAGVSTGRLVIFVIDQPNIRFGATAGIQDAVGRFIDRLQPSDRIAAVGIGPGAASTPFTSDHERVKQALARMSGAREASVLAGQPNLSLSEAFDIYEGNVLSLDVVLGRECAGLVGLEFSACRLSVESGANSLAQEALAGGRQTLISLTSLLQGLASVEAPKVVVLVSDGFVLEDERATLRDLGALATAARTSIYALRLDDQGVDAAVQNRSISMTADRFGGATSMEALAISSGGAFFNAVAGSVSALERIEREIAGYYLVAVESRPEDTDGRRREIEVDVSRRDTTVHWRREVSSGIPPPPTDSLRAAISALNSPLMMSALPLQVGTFSLSDPGRDTVQILLHVAVGAEHVAPGVASIAYAFADRNGLIVESQRVSAVLPPLMSGVPSPLQFRSTANLPPGEYMLRLAVVEGDRVGSVEHVMRAGLSPAGFAELSDLVVGGPVDAAAPLLPSVGHMVHFGLVHGYLEASGPEASRLRVRYEVAPAEDAPALLTTDIEPLETPNGLTVFTDVIEVRRLPEGEYVLRATVLDGDSADAPPLSTMTRRFEIAPPPVLMSPAEGGGGSLAAARVEVFLPVDDGRLNRPFDRRQATRDEVVGVFRNRVDSSVSESFDRGVSLLADGDYVRAETSFKNAIQISADSTAPIAYLAATFAAAGQDLQAAGAWQTALIDGSDLPQIYLWLADTLIRTRDMVQARSVLEEATSKWPGDARFAKPLALVYAAVGLGREAVRTIESHLEAEPGDTDALAMAVEWIYHLRIAGAVARNPAEDLRNAREYAEAYTRAKGPEAALVREWMSAIEEKP
jgi:VWFA-related protein